MKRLPLLVGIATFIIFVGGIFAFSKKESTTATLPPPTTHEYFYSPTCPHCTKVAEFINSWPQKEAFEMQKYDVTDSKNSNLFFGRGQACGIRPSELGVPLLVTLEGKCIVGDTPIIDYLKNWNQE